MFWEQTWNDLETKVFCVSQCSLASSKFRSCCPPSFLLLKTLLGPSGWRNSSSIEHCLLTVYLKKEKYQETQCWRLSALHQTLLTPKIHRAKPNQAVKTGAQLMRRNSVSDVERQWWVRKYSNLYLIWERVIQKEVKSITEISNLPTFECFCYQ